MDYSVGSLADLISGSNTPNKPKVLKKEFKQLVKREINSEPVAKSSKLKKLHNKKAKNGTISEEPGEAPPIQEKKLKRKKLKKENNEDQQENIQFAKKPKKAKRIVDLTNESEPVAQSTNQRKAKKRPADDKLTSASNETADLVDSDNESSPPKQQKLSKNEQNAERRIKKKDKDKKRVQDPEELARTIFVGNVPINVTKKKIKKHFKKYGKIESLRFRGIPVADPKTSKKVAAITKEFHPSRSNIYCYVRFLNKEDAHKAEAENGALFEEHHLRVHSCEYDNKPDESKAIFVGNLSFDAVEDELWKLFEACGPISYIRIIRDALSGLGKGFAYVNFRDADSVQLALGMENVKLKNRELRISLCNLNMGKKNKKMKKYKRKVAKDGKRKYGRPFNKNQGREVSNEQNNGPPKVKAIKAEFQGSKFTDKKKKHKVNKGLLEKKMLVKKIAPKPK